MAQLGKLPAMINEIFKRYKSRAYNLAMGKNRVPKATMTGVENSPVLIVLDSPVGMGGRYPIKPILPPTSAMISSASCTSSLVCAAVTQVRSRLLPNGTVGKKIGLTNNPASNR